MVEMLSLLTETTGGLLLLIYVGIALIAAEFFVKARGIAGLTGLISLGIYFYGTSANVSLWMIALFVTSVVLIVIDGKFVQDGTLATIGLVLMIISLVLPTRDVWLGAGVVCALLLGLLTSLLSFRLLPKRDLWERLTLRDRLTKESGYRSMNTAYERLVGKEGKALTDMRPSGTIEIDGERYSAVSDGTWVKKDSRIKVESVSGTRILVRENPQDPNGRNA